MSFGHENKSLIERLLQLVSKASGYSVYHEFHDSVYFISKVQDIIKRPVKLYKGYVNESFPQVFGPTFYVDWDHLGIHLTAGSNERDENLGMLKAKGELLERISTAAPLDEAVRNEYSKEYLYSVTEKELSVKRILGFGRQKVKYNEIYYFLHRIPHSKEIKTQTTTNGGAGHFELKKAIVGAWLELIQRDAFVVYWLNSIAPKKIEIEGGKNIFAETPLEKMINDFKKYHIDYYFLDITSDIEVPTCVCVLVSDSPTGKRIALGAASGFDAHNILLSAAREATTVLHSVYFKEPELLGDGYIPFSDRSFDRKKRIRAYLNDENFEKFKFFISSSQSTSVEDFMSLGQGIFVQDEDTEGQLVYLKKIFKKRYAENKNYDVLVHEVKNSLLDEFDYKVVKVICRAMYSLYLNENLADIDHPRLKEFVKAKGLEKKAKLNIWPHPFP